VRTQRGGGSGRTEGQRELFDAVLTEGSGEENDVEAHRQLLVGRLDVLVSSNGDRRRVNVLRDGDFFGERALLTGEPRNATVRTASACDLYSLGRAELLTLVEREPRFRELVTERDYVALNGS
jgi:CRP-like cAMP-binding protein